MIDASKNADLIAEGYRLSEKSLETQTTLALAADQRSVTLCEILIATIAIATSFSEESLTHWSPSLGLLGVAAAFSAYAARSVKIYSNIYEFSGIKEDLINEKPLVEVKLELASHFEDCSQHNRKVIRRNSRIFNFSLVVACLGFALLIWPSFQSVVCWSKL